MTKKRTTSSSQSGERASIETSGATRSAEACATFGLILVAASLMVPFAGVSSPLWTEVAKWVYTVGALIFTVARIVGFRVCKASFNIRRLRRLEAWAGIAFCVGAFFWFYNEARFGMGFGLTLGVLRETIMFTLAGALIQVIAVWLIYYREKKENASAK